MTSGGMDDEDAGIQCREMDIRRGSKKEQAECKRNKVNTKKEQAERKRNKVNENRRREGEKEKRANGGGECRKTRMRG